MTSFGAGFGEVGGIVRAAPGTGSVSCWRRHRQSVKNVITHLFFLAIGAASACGLALSHSSMAAIVMGSIGGAALFLAYSRVNAYALPVLKCIALAFLAGAIATSYITGLSLMGAAIFLTYLYRENWSCRSWRVDPLPVQQWFPPTTAGINAYIAGKQKERGGYYLFPAESLPITDDERQVALRDKRMQGYQGAIQINESTMATLVSIIGIARLSGGAPPRTLPPLVPVGGGSEEMGFGPAPSLSTVPSSVGTSHSSSGGEMPPSSVVEALGGGFGAHSSTTSSSDTRAPIVPVGGGEAGGMGLDPSPPIQQTTLIRDMPLEEQNKILVKLGLSPSTGVIIPHVVPASSAGETHRVGERLRDYHRMQYARLQQREAARKKGNDIVDEETVTLYLARKYPRTVPAVQIGELIAAIQHHNLVSGQHVLYDGEVPQSAALPYKLAEFIANQRGALGEPQKRGIGQ